MIDFGGSRMQALEASAEEQRLAMWVRIAKYKHKNLGSRSVVWRRNYLALKAWQAVHGALPTASCGEQEKILANWLARAKQLYKQGKLSRDQIQDLLKIPGVFERLLGRAPDCETLRFNPTKPIPTFDDIITRIQLWIRQHGSLPQAYRNRSEDWRCTFFASGIQRDFSEEVLGLGLSEAGEPELAAWVAYQRQRFLRRPWLLSEEQVELLKALPGFRTSLEKWNQSKESYLFQQRCDLVQRWVDKHGGGQLPSESHVGDLRSAESILDPTGIFSDDQNEWHMNLLNWVNQTIDMINCRKCTQSQRYTLRKYPCFANLMPKPQVKAEEPSRWWRRFRQLKRWISVSHRVPRSSTNSRMEQKLGWWLADTRQSYFKGTLDQDRLSHLWTLPSVATYFTQHLLPSGAVLSWDDRFSSLQAWLMTQNGRLPTRWCGDEDERQLAVWLQNSCAKARKDELHPERFAKLKQVPGLGPRLRGESPRLQVVWKGHHDSLIEWLEAHSGKLPCGSSGAAKERLMAFWLHNNLAKAQDGDLAPEKQEQLQEALGTSFRRFEAWCEMNGRLPHVGAKAGSERNLAIWLKNAVQGARRGNLDQERLAKLSRVPGVSDRLVTRTEKNISRVEAFKTWLSQHDDQPPSRWSSTSEERCFAFWLEQKLYRARQGKVPIEELQMLKSIDFVAEQLDDT
eukprot:s636_g14.t1